MPVTIRKATYSRDELVAAAKALMDANRGVITAAGPNHDLSAVWITLSSKAPQTALEAVRTQSTVPVESGGVLDIKRTAGQTSSQRECPAEPGLTVTCQARGQSSRIAPIAADLRFGAVRVKGRDARSRGRRRRP